MGIIEIIWSNKSFVWERLKRCALYPPPQFNRYAKSKTQLKGIDMKSLAIIIIMISIISCSSPPKKPGYIASGKSCSSILNSGKSSVDGVYMVNPDGNAPFKAYCNMTQQGGGWTLFAYHSDGVAMIKRKEFVNKSGYGVLSNKKWNSLKSNAKSGMMFVDENGLVSTLSLAKLNNGNCKSISSINDLTVNENPGKGGSGGLWHNEDSGCLLQGGDYSMIQLRGKSYKNYKIAGASLYQQSAVKFDVWPYKNDWSYENQNSLLFYIK